MDLRLRRHLTYGLFIAFVANMAIGYVKGEVDYTAIGLSILGLLGLINGARKSDKTNGDDAS